MTLSGVVSKKRGRVVAGIDGSPASIEALRWAITYAGFTGAATEVIVAWDWPANLGWAFPTDFESEMSAEQVLDTLIAQLRGDFPNQLVEGKVIQGHAAQILVEASVGASVLVVANRGHGEFAGMLLGSVSEYCVANAHCPVFVYRQDDARECSITPG